MLYDFLFEYNNMWMYVASNRTKEVERKKYVYIHMKKTTTKGKRKHFIIMEWIFLSLHKYNSNNSNNNTEDDADSMQVHSNNRNDLTRRQYRKDMRVRFDRSIYCDTRRIVSV